MGLAASITRTYVQVGVDNQEQMNKYQELKNAAQEKLGKNFTSEHDRICSILAKDKNATVEDVENMYNQINQEGIWGQQGTSTLQRLQNFQRALKQIPGYNNANLSSENLSYLLELYNSSYIAQISGEDPLKTFFAQAEQYIKDNAGSSSPINDDTKKELSNNTNNLFNELQESGNSNETAEPEEPATPEDSTIGADMLGKLNLINLGIRKTFTTFN